MFSPVKARSAHLPAGKSYEWYLEALNDMAENQESSDGDGQGQPGDGSGDPFDGADQL